MCRRDARSAARRQDTTRHSRRRRFPSSARRPLRAAAPAPREGATLATPSGMTVSEAALTSPGTRSASPARARVDVAPALRLEIVTSLAAVHDLRAEWERLEREVRDATVF